MHATEQPLPKPSRYRTIRGKNVPESRRFVEPEQQQQHTQQHTQTQPLQTVHPVETQTETPTLPTSTSSSSNDSSTTPNRYPSRYHARRSAGPPRLATAAAIAASSAANAPPLPSGSPSSSLPHASPQLSSPQSSHMRHAGPTAAAPASAAPAAPAVPAASTVAPHATASAPASPFSPQTSFQPPPSLQTQSLPFQSHQVLQSPLNLVPLPRRDIYDDDTNESTDHHQQLLEEQKRKDLERLEKELAAASLTPPADPKRQAKSPSRERFHLFSRRNKADKADKVDKTDRADSPKAFLHKPPPIKTTSLSLQTSPPPVPVPMPSATTTATATSASATASPIGEPGCRYVVVRCQQFSATISVLPETTVADALEAAAPLLPSGLVDLPSSILVESYSRLGLERRLRRYERVRDIMNSWDTDANNTFVIMRHDSRAAVAVPLPASSTSPTTKFGSLQDLDLHSAPRGTAPPAGFASVQMHYSQKPGRWSKRYISLLEDAGQLVLSKKEDADSHDLTGLCHLSDYDIYLPTDAQMKLLRPPKTFCFAVKSQQRTTVFVNTENYVHFFSTDDAAVARLFYERVFNWRSWYLAKRIPLEAADSSSRERERERPEKNRPPVSMALMKSGLQRSLSRRSAGNAPASEFYTAGIPSSAPPTSTTHEHARRPTDESLFGGAGNFEPTLDFGSSSRGRQPPQVSRQAQAQRERGQSARSDRSLDLDANRSASNGLQSAPLAPSSWFPSASEHSAQQAQHQRSRSIVRDARDNSRSTSRSRPVSQQEDIPLGLQYPQLVQQQMQSSTGLGRSRSTRSMRRAPFADAQAPPLPTNINMPQPLIDLTPKFQEAPQWSKEGKGHGVRAPKGAHLVDLATDRPRQPHDFTATAPLRRDFSGNSGNSGNNNVSYPPPSRSGRSQTMTSSSQGAAAAAVSRSRSVVHHGRDGREGRSPAPPMPVPLLARIPSNNAGQVGEGRGY